MSAPGANPGAGSAAGREAAGHPHEIFVYLGKLYARALAMRAPNINELLEAMAGYVRAQSEGDTWFDDEWRKLSQRIEKARGLSVTGVTGMTREEARARQFSLIMEAARRYHVLENGQGKTTPRTIDEKRERIKKEIKERREAPS